MVEHKRQHYANFLSHKVLTKVDIIPTEADKLSGIRFFLVFIIRPIYSFNYLTTHGLMVS